VLVEARKGAHRDFVFPGLGAARPLSVMAMEMLLRRMNLDSVTVHGFRSAFRDWAGNETHFPGEVAEAALAHVIGDAAERAYRRGDALAFPRAEHSRQCREPSGERIVLHGVPKPSATRGAGSLQRTLATFRRPIETATESAAAVA
jgi:hypothetical protein